jgi:hypothetical protein
MNKTDKHQLPSFLSRSFTFNRIKNAFKPSKHQHIDYTNTTITTNPDFIQNMNYFNHTNTHNNVIDGPWNLQEALVEHFDEGNNSSCSTASLLDDPNLYNGLDFDIQLKLLSLLEDTSDERGKSLADSKDVNENSGTGDIFVPSVFDTFQDGTVEEAVVVPSVLNSIEDVAADEYLVGGVVVAPKVLDSIQDLSADGLVNEGGADVIYRAISKTNHMYAENQESMDTSEERGISLADSKDVNENSFTADFFVRSVFDTFQDGRVEEAVVLVPSVLNSIEDVAADEYLGSDVVVVAPKVLDSIKDLSADGLVNEGGVEVVYRAISKHIYAENQESMHNEFGEQFPTPEPYSKNDARANIKYANNDIPNNILEPSLNLHSNGEKWESPFRHPRYENVLVKFEEYKGIQIVSEGTLQGLIDYTISEPCNQFTNFSM